MRVIVLVLVLFGLSACSSDPDGELIDGIWVGAPADCSDMGNLDCDDVIACATVQAWPSNPPSYRSANVFDKPAQLKDATLINYGIGGFIVVFGFHDGKRVARYVVETDNC
jgi:hypothetical protein